MKTAVLILLILQTLWISYIIVAASDRPIVTRIFLWLLFALPSVVALIYIIAV